MDTIQIVILAAGKGTRMKTQFPDIPKVLVQIDHIPMIIRLIQMITESRILVERIIVVIRPDDERLFKNELGRYMPGHQIHLICQDDEIDGCGTGAAVHAVLRHRLLSEWTMILNGDAPLLESTTLEKLSEQIRMDRDVIVGTVHLKNPAGYGRIIKTPSLQIIEQTEIDVLPEDHDWRHIREVNTGIYVIRSDLFRRINEIDVCPIISEKPLTAILKMATSPICFSDFKTHEVLNVNTPHDRNYAEYICFKKREDLLHRSLFTILRKEYSQRNIVS